MLRFTRCAWAWLSLGALLAVSGPASGFEALDGRLQLHGYYEAQIRSIARDFDPKDGWDLTQWWNVLDLEIEWALSPNGIGPFDNINLFGRIEVRYDCVWTRSCGMFRSADTYGDRSGRLPGRLSDARRSGFSGTLWTDDTRAYYDVPYTDVNATPDHVRLRPDGAKVTQRFWQTPVGAPFFGSGSYGVDGIPHFANDNQTVLSNDDPPFYYFDNLLRSHCDEWSTRARPNGPQNGRGNLDILVLDPACDYRTIGAAADKANPFRAGDINPQSGNGGALPLPYRPAPRYDFESGAPLDQARGVYYPNARLQQLIRDGDLTSWRTNYSQAELAWNRGQSQQDQKELKELYADVEMFDSRLWLRIGYQTIVWGKTELFRNQDQFNPQDVALGSLTSLEESRISLWAIRAVWSFYDVGPLADVRLELAMNYDQYEPTDLGTCGEPYTVLAACALSIGQIAHGYFGLGLAGQERPPDPWSDSRGIEGGARLEFRWDRFSFAITDFYGYQDFPYVETVFRYSRNVDPVSGRPRHTMTDGRCRTGKESACLDSGNALSQHSANQQLFAMVCANTVAIVASLDPSACFANIFGSPNRTGAPGETLPRVVVALNLIAQGDVGDTGLILPTLAEYLPGSGGMGSDPDSPTVRQIQRFTYDGRGKVTVNLNADPNDGGPDLTNAAPGNSLLGASDFNNTVGIFYTTFGGSLSGKLTDWQEALLGCGRFFKTSCDLDGVDLLNAEASVLFQSWPDVAGTFNPDTRQVWDTTDRRRAQPGTVGFRGGPLCTRFENGKTYILPGCRGPRDPGYDPKVDGTVTGILHPFTGQQFNNELAGLSWNLLMGLVGLSLAPRDFGATTGPRHTADRADFDPADPFRHGGCSFREPEWCSSVTAFLGLSGLRRNDIRAGGNGEFGRRDFVWQSGGTAVLRYDKPNILGFSMDFAEDVTKSNWGIEFTWVNGLHLADNNSPDGLGQTDSYRLTISVDRPTFVNFLNANRTFFFNTQWFFEYENRYRSGFLNDGPFDVFGVFAVSTGYFQDRLLPSLVLVYFVSNNSFAVLPEVSYRFTENFSATFGVAAFAGREETRTMPIDEVSVVGDRFGRNAYQTSVENGLAVIRERDEAFLRIKYTF
jgi:Protein of unknown function (DUF1302)